MAITADSAQQLIRLIKQKVQSGALDKKTAEHLAVLALQEVQIADEESQAADTSAPPEDDGIEEESLEDDDPKPAPLSKTAVDPASQLLALINQFDQHTAGLWANIKAKIEEILRGVEGAAFPLGDFSTTSSTAAKGNKTKITIKKATGATGVDVDFAFDRNWTISGLNPPAEVASASAKEPACHLGLRKELLAFTQDMIDLTETELGWKRSHFPEGAMKFLTASSKKENDPRVLEAVANVPASNDRQAWRKWSLTAQAYVLGNDYVEKKAFKDLEKEVATSLEGQA